jgi:exonuclease 1
MELAMNKPTRKYAVRPSSRISLLIICRFVDFAMHRVRMLIHFGVIPFLVFDGDYLPSKAATEADRAKRREDSKKLGFELLNAGKASQANLEFQKAVDVTPEMVRLLIDELKKTGVQYVVAPYEADAQMVYLERKGVIQGILSEDSDLLVFGAKCLLTKLDQYGNCIEINKSDFCRCREINLTGWSDTEFRHMAILSGCDYLNSINNMGLKTAYRMVRKHKTIEKVVKMLQFDGKYHVPKDYMEAFYQAELTFLHQRVFCPVSNTLVLHTEPDQPLDLGKMPFIGAYVEPEVASRVASGELHPMTKQRILGESNQGNTPRTPWAASRPQARRPTTSLDLKKGVSIEEFFRPKRIPLAELDPNCFTPSPSQQNALLRNSDSWAADSVLRTYLHQAVTDTEPQPQALSPISQVSRTLPFSRSNSDNPHPPKRTRLCADDALIEGQRDSTRRSRFFDSPAADPSPSVGRSTKAKRSKKDDITIFSDDSIEEALLNLPDYDGWHKLKPKHKSITIFDETQISLQDSQPLSKEISTAEHEFQRTVAAGDSQTTVPSLTQSSSILSFVEEPQTPIESAALPIFGGLKENFAFTPSSTSSWRRPLHDLPTPPSSVNQSRIPRAVERGNRAVSSTKATPSRVLTPLQSLGARALKLSSTLPLTPLHTSANTSSRTTPKHLIEKPISARGVPFPQVARPSLLKTVLEPCDIPLPLPEKDEVQALLTEVVVEVDSEAQNTILKTNGAKGSEDLIIHDSEEEPDCDILEPVESPGVAPKLDLERFAFQVR